MSRLVRGISLHGVLGLALLCLSVAGSWADRGEEILAFAQPWIGGQDYAWRRESRSFVGEEKDPAITIEDEGRFRVEFIKYEDESAQFQVHVLVYRFRTTLKGEEPEVEESDLQGEQLPPIFLHWALGFSFDAPADYRVQQARDQQASQILELMDFRGFVPKEVPKDKMEWPLKIVPDRGASFRFKEEVNRIFRCESSEADGGNTRCKIHFTEQFKVTPEEKNRPWELTEKEGNCVVSLPKGMVESADWKAVSTESSGNDKAASRLRTETTVALTRVPVKHTSQPAKKKAFKIEDLPLPPR